MLGLGVTCGPKTRPWTLLLLWLLLVCTPAGCVRRVVLAERPLVEMTRENVPTTRTADGREGLALDPRLDGDASVTLPYDGLLWAFTRLPFVRSSDMGRERVMLDTGMDGWAIVTRDVAADRKLPAHDFGGGQFLSYTAKLSLGGVAVTGLPSYVWNESFEVRVLFVPVFRLRGWALGNGALRRASFLAFDNPRRRVTIGREPFVPNPDLAWTEYPIEWAGRGAGHPYVSIPVAGQTLRVLADSAGGPKLILDPEQWAQVKDHVRVRRHAVDRYPTWGRFVAVDVYTIERLTIGPVTLRNAKVWVRREREEGSAALLGLGPLDGCVVVWDYKGKRLWIGRAV